MKMNLFSEEIFNSGKLNNIAIRTFKITLSLGTLLAIVAELSGSPALEKYLKVDQIVLFVIATNFIFAGLIFVLGEPTKVGWDKDKLIKTIKKSKYYKKHTKNDDILENSIKSLKKEFSKNWSLLWASWALLYSVLFIHKIIGIDIKSYEIFTTGGHLCLNVIENGLNLLSSYFLFSLYLVLIHKSGTKYNIENSIAYRKDQKKFKYFVYGLLLTESAIYFSSATFYGVLESRLEVILKAGTYFKYVNGFLGAVTLSLFVARLIGSNTTVFKGKEKVILPLLFLYCAIQPSYEALNQENNAIMIVGILLIALVCKYILYYVVVKLFDTRIILFHFIETGIIREEIAKSLPMFKEIWEVPKKET